MMPTIRVEDDVFEGLKSLAEPFTDTPNSVIRRLLEKQGVQVGKRKIIPEIVQATLNMSTAPADENHSEPSRLTPQSIYETFLLHTLANTFHGRASKSDATKAAIQQMKARGFIGTADLARVSTGETKAENTVAWGRNALKDQGLISRNSPKGIWELTEIGLEEGQKVILPSKSLD